MKIALLDDVKSRRTQIVEGLGKHYDVLICATSNDLINAVQNGKNELFLIEVETWNKGKSIYNYLNLSKKLEKKPIIFYNAEEGFANLPERAKNEKDQILRKPTEVQAVIDTVQKM